MSFTYLCFQKSWSPVGIVISCAIIRKNGGKFQMTREIQSKNSAMHQFMIYRSLREVASRCWQQFLLFMQPASQSVSQSLQVVGSQSLRRCNLNFPPLLRFSHQLYPAAMYVYKTSWLHNLNRSTQTRVMFTCGCILLFAKSSRATSSQASPGSPRKHTRDATQRSQM